MAWEGFEAWEVPVERQRPYASGCELTKKNRLSDAGVNYATVSANSRVALRSMCAIVCKEVVVGISVAQLRAVADSDMFQEPACICRFGLAACAATRISIMFADFL